MQCFACRCVCVGEGDEDEEWGRKEEGYKANETL